jgi:beta-glucosidase
MRRSLMAAAMFVAASIFSAQAAEPDDVERRVDSLLQRMSVEEKIDLLGGVNGFDVRGVPSIGLPLMTTADGPFGVRRQSRANIMAGGIALAATWNVELAREYGNQIGRDARARGVHFYLAPGVNMYRSPLNGRNFEYMGEDPYLAARLAVPFIQAVQSHGVAATVKHFLGNNSEFLRHTSDSVIDERTLREIYMPAFEAAVKQGRVASVMNSYNLVNGEHATQSRHINLDVLKGEWGFDGVLMSDWDSTYDTLAAANAGLDLEMPFGKHLNRETLLPLLRSGQVKQATLDDKVRRILRTAVRLGWLDREQRDRTIPLYNLQGRQVALQAARESMVLLKNERELLPLDRARVKKLVVLGPNAYPAVTQGGGSVKVVPFTTVSVLEGLAQHLGTNAAVLHSNGILDLRAAAQATEFSTAASGGEPGVNVEVFDNDALEGQPAITRVDRRINQGAPLDFAQLALGLMDRTAMTAPRRISMRWTGYFTPNSAGAHDAFMQFGGFGRGVGHRLFVDDVLVSDHWESKHAATESLAVNLDARSHKIRLDYHGEVGSINGMVPFVRFGLVRQGTWVEPAVEQMARDADAVVLSVGFDEVSEMEDWDRTFALPPGQDELIRAVAAVNPNTIVVVNSGGAIDTNAWLSSVPAYLQAWYPGQEGGTALAEILFGDVNPSGKLPATFERQAQDNPTYTTYYPQPGTKRVTYAEGVFVGYRGYEKNGVAPLYAFGHGLSYTTFAYQNLQITPRATTEKRGDETLYDVTFTVTNTGKRAGAAVPQLYVSDLQSSVARPPKELKGFTKVTLQPGESRTVTIPLDARAFAYYDVTKKKWRAEAGAFAILVGSSSAQVELQAQVKLPRTFLF